MPFAVRNLPSTGLDGAFRVHLLADDLQHADLTVGDVCEIQDAEREKALGYGIAWRASERLGASPKVRPAKMTERLKAAYGINDGSLVNLVKTSAKLVHAEKITLTDVTPEEYGDGYSQKALMKDWFPTCIYTLSKCE